MLCECCITLLKFDTDLSDECRTNINETVNFIVEHFNDYNEDLRFILLDIQKMSFFRLSIFNFLSFYSCKVTEKCEEIVSSLKSAQKCEFYPLFLITFKF